MTEGVNFLYQTIDEQNAEKSASTRRQLVAGAAATLGGMGLLSTLPDVAEARHQEDPQTILNVAATAEQLATLVNLLGVERALPASRPELAVARRNTAAAATEEFIHYNVLISPGFDAKPLTESYWIPDAILADPTSFLTALEYGDQIFINAYLIATTVLGNRGNGALARVFAEFMGVEMVHRALARQALGKLGNDRAFAKYSQPEGAADAPRPGLPGFRRVTSAVAQLEAAGFGFGKPGSLPGRLYAFEGSIVPNERALRPSTTGVNTIVPSA